MVHPIIDEYYNYNPYHSRSSKFVQDKGLVTNEKGTPSRSPAGTPNLAANENKRLGPSNLHDSIASTLTPSMHSSVSPVLIPTTEPDLRHLAAVQNTNNFMREHKPQELGNTKKKRKSIVGAENFPIHTNVVASSSPVEEPEIRAAAYGDPMKIAQYFPELN
jgi:glutamine amidotransferase